MGERRMFTRKICMSDAFLDMPASTRCLYFTLGLFADDDGFVNNPKSIMRQIAATNDDMNILLAKDFVISFQSGVIVIKHWLMHNYIRSDRYKETEYKQEKAQLVLDANKEYQLISEQLEFGIPMVDEGCTQDKLREDKLSKDNCFQEPTQQEIIEYAKEIGSKIDPLAFYDYYKAKGWKLGQEVMADWKAVFRNWERKRKKDEPVPKRQEYKSEVLSGIPMPKEVRESLKEKGYFK